MEKQKLNNNSSILLFIYILFLFQISQVQSTNGAESDYGMGQYTYNLMADCQTICIQNVPNSCNTDNDCVKDFKDVMNANSGNYSDDCKDSWKHLQGVQKYGDKIDWDMIEKSYRPCYQKVLKGARSDTGKTLMECYLNQN
ncbi:hypothetical protein PPERSA_10600 [Pseudocohnilembus persalinus]|uniref:Transmembrane protein n=1 Tax=Pseudocohnilembus persalinus TaxID=266149 RepID=A0A0V0Q9A8_PSEPJ|nr:hypothetical protein PPERSA_10600 [Pseudocohnilembus persalinus]|eukprot:KRW98829.1 hypothetical protein PPERSA_10600 [Pseudocohnilembus persalinus]